MVFYKNFFFKKAIFKLFRVWNSYLIPLIFRILVLESLNR
jgi:hypothetical protein